jgi:tetratricopeptide (TPR) repeat protein
MHRVASSTGATHQQVSGTTLSMGVSYGGSPKKICVSDDFWGVQLSLWARTKHLRVVNLLAGRWDIISHSIKMLASEKSEKTMKNTNYRPLRAAVKMRQFLTVFATLSAVFFFFGCTTMRQSSRDPEVDRSDQFARAKVLFKEGNYEAAMKENQKLLSEGKAPADMALYNMGLIFACSLNPKKDYQKALDTFKKLVSQYPHSSFAEEVKVWIQVLEEHQKIADERQKFLEENRNLTREREILSQEREKLKYTVEKSRQLDIEIEKRRRQTQSR